MKIVVVGGNGFIGKEFVSFASKFNHEVTIIEKDVDVFTEDGENTAFKIIKNSEAMVFLAAIRPFSEFSQNEYLYNIRIANKYIDIARLASLNNIVITSSRSVYSSDVLPWKENDFQAPLSLYGASKQAIDSLVLLYNSQYNMKIKSLRLAQVIGTGEKKGYLLNTLIDNAANKTKQVIFGSGIGKRQYIYIKDVCDVILHCLTTCKDKSGIYNIGIDNNISILHLAELINNVFDNTSGIETRINESEDKKEYLMDVGKSKNELGWEPKYNLPRVFEDIKING